MKSAAYLTLVVLIGGATLFGLAVQSQDMAFGGKDDVEFAESLWKAMEGYTDWQIKTGLYEGRSPHGKFLRSYYNIVPVNGANYHVIIKDNYGGPEAAQETVAKAPGDYLAAVTVMVQREAGYDPENGNWFWVKYGKDGTIEKNPKGMALAGRVAKGADQGCIACHSSAKGDDYFFTNDQ